MPDDPLCMEEDTGSTHEIDLESEVEDESGEEGGTNSNSEESCAGDLEDSDSDSSTCEDEVGDSGSHSEAMTNEQQKTSDIVMYILILFILWACLHFVSFSAASSILPLFPAMLKALIPGGGPLAAMMIAIFPTTWYLCKKFIAINKATKYTEYFVVCKKCCSLYKLNDCYEEDINGIFTFKRCSEIPFAQHRQCLYQETCNSALGNSIKLRNGKTKVVPKCVYPYTSLTESLKRFLS